MKIKDYKCKCGHNDFFIDDKRSQKGIYCTYCGKWLKWADKDEQKLLMNPRFPLYSDVKIEQIIEPIDKSAMLYEIYMKGVNMTGEYQGCWVRFKDIEKIVDKYMAESEDKE